MASSVYFEPRCERTAADRLGDEITEPCGYSKTAPSFPRTTCPIAEWYAGEEMDMEYAVWVMANAKPPGESPDEEPVWRSRQSLK